MHQSTYKSPLGNFFLWFNEHNLIYATFQQQEGERFVAKHFPKIPVETCELAEEYQEDLAHYFSGQRIEFNWPLYLIGTEFQRKVWHEINQIPHGQFSTYKRIAQRIDSKAYQAVGQAVGANPVSLIVPCHRVLGTHGLGGYGGGINLKRLLLELENVTLAPNLRA